MHRARLSKQPNVLFTTPAVVIVDDMGRRTRSDRGFTLIELLVVLVIVGVLIGIAIPVYRHFKEGAYAVTAKADLNTLRLEESAYQGSTSSFGTTRQLLTANPRLKVSSGSAAAVIWSTADGFCLGATNTRAPADSSAPFASSGFAYKTYFYDSTTGNISQDLCATPNGAAGMDGYLDDSGLH
jgi:type IV pilus assembly protein PilA